MPEIEWAVEDRIPLRQVSLLSGEGAVAKTLLGLQRCVAHAASKYWLGMKVAAGPAVYFGAEDEANIIHRRAVDIAAHYDVRFSDLAGQLHLLSMAGKDAVLGAPDGHGIIRPTALFEQLKERVCDIRPKLIMLDTSSDIFAGNENDRAQVRQFIGILRGLAIASNANVEICSHPSLTGMASGSGLSGTTGWHNAVRARAYLTTPKPERSEEPDPGLRQLQFKKNNYGPSGAEGVLLRWRQGVFVLEPGEGPLEKLALDQKAEDLFLTLLAQFEHQGRSVSEKKTAPNSAPAEFAKEPTAGSIGKNEFARAMRRLFAANKIRVEPYGRPSRPYSKIVACNSPCS